MNVQNEFVIRLQIGELKGLVVELRTKADHTDAELGLKNTRVAEHEAYEAR